MMADMPRPRPPFLHRERSRHKASPDRWYFRRGDEKRVRIRAEYGSAEFWAQYEAAKAGSPIDLKPKLSKVALEWLIARYRETTVWHGLSMATRKQRENIFKGVIAFAGSQPYGGMTKALIVAGREKRASTPAQARNYLDAMRGLYRWALEAEHVTADPTAGVANPKKAKGDGFPVWSEADLDAYEKRWPLGTKERVWLHVLLYTGLRRGDAVTIGRQHVKDGVATLKTEKSQYTVEVTLPILAELAETLAAGPTGDLSFICGDRGRPLTKETFGNDFREACRAAGVQKSAHGVRKIGATRAANNGATVSQLEAIFGWSGGAMASLYTRAADRRRLAMEAMKKLGKGTPSGHSIPAPDDMVRASKAKAC